MIVKAVLALGAVIAAEAPPPSPPVTSDYDEVQIGPWSLRSDPEATTFWSFRKGVVELSARSADGKAEWYLLDNGGVLRSEVHTPRCILFASETNYPDGAKQVENSVIEFAKYAVTPEACSASDYRADLAKWAEALPIALEAMKARSRRMFGEALERCITPPHPPRDPNTPPPPPTGHPRCGFPSDRVGEKSNDW